jgi:hypothetical protein
MFTRSLFVAFAALALAAGCSKTGDVDFTITKTYSHTNNPPNPVNSGGGGAAYTSNQPVNLASEAGEAWDHRDKIKSVELVGLDATMTAVNSGGPAYGNGAIRLSRGGGTPVTVGRWTHELLQTAPHSIAVSLDGGGMSIVDDALRNDGVFDVVFTGSTDAAINFDAEVKLHIKMTYKIKVP